MLAFGYLVVGLGFMIEVVDVLGKCRGFGSYLVPHKRIIFSLRQCFLSVIYVGNGDIHTGELLCEKARGMR